MRYLLVVPQIGFDLSGGIIPGGLLQFSRCVIRALASSPSIEKLGIWTQVDPHNTEPMIERMVRVYAHPGLELDVRSFGGSRTKLTYAVALVCLKRAYDRVMYLLVNQATISALPWHPPYTVWEVGREVFECLPFWKYRALRSANLLLSISKSTSEIAKFNNPGLQDGRVVHLCVEPPLFELDPLNDPLTDGVYDPTGRDLAVLIVANLYQKYLYKGHRHLIAAWQKVVEVCSDAELWIVGDGDGRPELEEQTKNLPHNVAKKILFLGQLDDASLDQCYKRCRVFAMPSSGEGFGLVFVEAARYGVPCIGGKYDSVKEIVLHNETGLLVEQHPYDIALACLKLLTDDQLAKRFGEAGRQRYLTNFRFHHFRARLLKALKLNSDCVSN